MIREQRSGASGYDTTYTYDAVGNRLVQEDAGALTTYVYDAANQLLSEEGSSGVSSYTYDADGNRTEKDTPAAVTYYTWDEENHLTEAEPPSGSVSLEYNALGQRVQKQSDSQTRQYIYDFDRLLQETDDSGQTQSLYTSTLEEYGDLVSEFDGAETTYYQYDALGSADALLDENETAADRYKYKAFGLEYDHSGSSLNPFTFVGQQHYYKDSELELYALGMGNSDGGGRQYDAATGTFLSKDPAEDDINAYRYVENNPVGATDPSGHAALRLNARVAAFVREWPQQKRGYMKRNAKGEITYWPFMCELADMPRKQAIGILVRTFWASRSGVLQGEGAMDLGELKQLRAALTDFRTHQDKKREICTRRPKKCAPKPAAADPMRDGMPAWPPAPGPSRSGRPSEPAPPATRSTAGISPPPSASFGPYPEPRRGAPSSGYAPPSYPRGGTGGPSPPITPPSSGGSSDSSSLEKVVTGVAKAIEPVTNVLGLFIPLIGPLVRLFSRTETLGEDLRDRKEHTKRIEQFQDTDTPNNKGKDGKPLSAGSNTPPVPQSAKAAIEELTNTVLDFWAFATMAASGGGGAPRGTSPAAKTSKAGRGGKSISNKGKSLGKTGGKGAARKSGGFFSRARELLSDILSKLGNLFGFGKSKKGKQTDGPATSPKSTPSKPSKPQPSPKPKPEPKRTTPPEPTPTQKKTPDGPDGTKSAGKKQSPESCPPNPPREPSKTTKGGVKPNAPKKIPGSLDDILVATEQKTLRLNNKSWGSTKFANDSDSIVYILRDADTGEFLKVGKTEVGKFKGRFGPYDRAQGVSGRNLEVDTFSFKAKDFTPEQIEKQVRDQLTSQGHKLPWDNTGQRLGRTGPGVPGVRPPRRLRDQGWRWDGDRFVKD